MSGFVPPTKRGGPSVKTPVPASLPSKKKSAAASALKVSGAAVTFLTSQRTVKLSAPAT